MTDHARSSRFGPTALAGGAWLALVALAGAFGPLLASGHPVCWRTRGADDLWGPWSSPLLRQAAAADLMLPLGVLISAVVLVGSRGGRSRTGPGARPGGVAVGRRFHLVLAIWCTIIAGLALGPGARALGAGDLVAAVIAGAGGLLAGVLVLVAAGRGAPAAPASRRSLGLQVSTLLSLALVGGVLAHTQARPPLARFEGYHRAIAAGQGEGVFSVVPWSPGQSDPSRRLRPPGETALGARLLLGSDGDGVDVLTQMLRGCRLAISIGIASAGIALSIGVVAGLLMGYLGGWVDLVLLRVVEIVMAVPLLFLLILAAGVLPRELRTEYVLMAIIGCFSWTGAARLTRAETLKLRDQDVVAAARAAGLPTRLVLLRHVLPSAIAPVLVEASFAVASAILAEATLSYLGLGVSGSGNASWGRLLAEAWDPSQGFIWWLGVFPGGAIFLTVLAYNLLGEALRDALDPRVNLRSGLTAAPT